MQLYVLHGEQEVGPYDEEAIHHALDSRAITSDQLAWTAGQDSWRPLHELIVIKQAQPIEVTIPPPLPPAVTPPATRRIKNRLVRGILLVLAVLVGGYVLLVLLGLTVGLMLGGFNQPTSTTGTSGSAQVMETAEARALRQTLGYWDAMHQIRAEGRAIVMPDMRLLEQKKYDEAAQQCITAAREWNVVAAKLRTLPTLDVEPELVEITLQFAEWFGEVADTCDIGYGFVRHAERFNRDYSSGGAMLESFVRGMAGDHPMNKLNEGREDQKRLQEHGEQLTEGTNANSKRGNEIITQFARLKASLTQKYRTEFK